MELLTGFGGTGKSFQKMLECGKESQVAAWRALFLGEFETDLAHASKGLEV